MTNTASRNTSLHLTILLFILLRRKRQQVGLPLCFMRHIFPLNYLKEVFQSSVRTRSPRTQVLSEAQKENNSRLLPKYLGANHCIIKKMRVSMQIKTVIIQWGLKGLGAWAGRLSAAGFVHTKLHPSGSGPELTCKAGETSTLQSGSDYNTTSSTKLYLI